MIILIKHMVDWEIILQQKQDKINKDKIRKNRHRVDHNYKVGDNVMLSKHTEYKYKTTYTSPFVIKQCLTNGMVNLQYGETKSRYSTNLIKP